MALLGFEGFDISTINAGGTANGNDISQKPFLTGIGGQSGGVWSVTSPGAFSLVTGLLGLNKAVQCSTANSGTLTVSLGSSPAHSFTGIRFKTSSAFAATVDIYKFFDGATAQCGVSVNTSGKLIVWRGSNATVLGTGSTTLLTSSIYFLEVELIVGTGTAGQINVYLNGVSEIATGGVNTQNSGNAQITAFQINSPGNTSGAYTHDDLYILDSSGSAPYNTFLGIITVETDYPTSANSTTWTPNASTNVSRIQDTTSDGDTTYNSTATSTNADTFLHGALTNTPVTIFGVSVTAVARKEDVSNLNIKTQLISGVTTQDGASSALGTGYRGYRDTYINDPNTTIAWTTAAANASAIGYKLP